MFYAYIRENLTVFLKTIINHLRRAVVSPFRIAPLLSHVHAQVENGHVVRVGSREYTDPQTGKVVYSPLYCHYCPLC